MKLLLINYMTLPIPPVKGGAVEYLVNEFLLHNEEKHLHDIVAYSIYDEAAEVQSRAYKHTEFKFIKIEGIFDKIDRAVRHIINKHTGVYVGNTYITKILKNERNLNQYDAIIIENAPDFCLRIPKSFKGRVILHLHNDFLNSETKNAKKIFDRCDEIYTISNSLGDCVKTIEQSGKVKTLYNGVDLKKFSFSADMRDVMRKKYGIKKDDFVFMFCGRIVPDKGVLQMVKAFKKIEKENIKLVIVGGIRYSNNNVDKYLQSVMDVGCKNIVFTGFVPYSEMPELYTMADVGMVPSVFNDPFNLTCIEFCANGIPVLISDRGAMKELVNEKCSIIAKCDDKFTENISGAMAAFLKKEEKLSDMRNEAKKVSEKFGIETYCENFSALLNGVFGSL